MLTSWSTLKSQGVRGQIDYMDQESTLNYAECYKLFGNEIYKSNISPASCGNFLNSVELLRIINFLNLSVKDSFAIGTTFMWLTISILCLMFFISKELGKTQYAIAMVACLSPGVWLLLERGNYDELMFCLTVAAGFLLGSRYKVLGVLIVGFTVLLKFYTLPAFVFALLQIENKKIRRIFLLTLIPLLLYTLKLFSQVVSFPSTWSISFGLKSLGLYSELAMQYFVNSSILLPTLLTPVPGLILLAILTFLMKRFAVRPSLRIEDPKKLQRITYLYNLLLVVFLSCYFAGINYDYRLVYLSFLVGISSAIFHLNRYSAILIVSGLLALTFNTYLFGLNGIPSLAIQMSGDLFLSTYVATQLVYLIAINPVKTLKMLKNVNRYI